MNTRYRIFKLWLMILIALPTISPGRIRAFPSNDDARSIPAELHTAIKNALGSDIHLVPRNDMTQQAKLLASDKANADSFGWSVSLSADSNTAIVGAVFDDDSGTTDNGAAYVFIRSGGVWTQQAKLLASDKASGDYFGCSVSLTTDGNIAVIGAIGEASSGTTENGAAYVFIRSGSLWGQQAKLLASDKTDFDKFGASVSISADGVYALIGAYGDDDSGTIENGAAYVFKRMGNSWNEQDKFLASDKATGDMFGYSVALSGDGSTALIGAHYEDDSGTTDNGAAYIFRIYGGPSGQQAKLLASDKADSDNFGYAVSFSADGNTAVVGAYNENDSGTTDNGAVYIFTGSGSTWTQQAKLLASDKADGDIFGSSVSVSANGNALVIGAYDESDSGTTGNGAAYVFSRSGSIWTQQGKLLAADKADNADFGWSASISGDGNTTLIGSRYQDEAGLTDNGAAYVFVTIPPTPTPTATKTNTRTFTPTFAQTATNTATRTATPVLYPQGIGCYDPVTYTFFLRNSLTAGAPDFTITGYGSMAGDVPIVGDWNNDKIDTIGIYRRATGEFFLRDSNALGAPNYTLVLGNPDDTPLHGRWDDTMSGDGVGVFRPSNGILYLKKQLTTGFSDFFLIMGNPSDIGISGDWDGDGIDSPGIYRVDEGKFYLTNSVTNGIVFADTVFAYGSGTSGATNPYRDIPVPGDWDGNISVTAGVYNTQTGTFYLRNANTVGAADYAFAFCSPGTLPIAGHWMN